MKTKINQLFFFFLLLTLSFYISCKQSDINPKSQIPGISYTGKDPFLKKISENMVRLPALNDNFTKIYSQSKIAWDSTLITSTIGDTLSSINIPILDVRHNYTAYFKLRVDERQNIDTAYIVNLHNLSEQAPELKFSISEDILLLARKKGLLVSSIDTSQIIKELNSSSAFLSGQTKKTLATSDVGCYTSVDVRYIRKNVCSVAEVNSQFVGRLQQKVAAAHVGPANIQITGTDVQVFGSSSLTSILPTLIKEVMNEYVECVVELTSVTYNYACQPTATPPGGNSGGGPDGNGDVNPPNPDPDWPSFCGSWKYEPTDITSDYQVCGVQGLRFDYLTEYQGSDNKLHADYYRGTFTRTIYFEFPRVRANGALINQQLAAQLTAAAKDRAEEILESQVEASPPPRTTMESNSMIERFYRILQNEVSALGGRVTKTNNYNTTSIAPYSKTITPCY